MQKLLATLFLLCLSVGLQILVFTKGWGLHPGSWLWIIGGGFIGEAVLLGISVEILNEK